MENVCGKSCGECSWKETLKCPGCQDGPGNPLAGDCRITQCCREKGHETCATCRFLDRCWTQKESARMPELRMQIAERRMEERKRLGERAPVVGKWLGVLFWLFIPGAIAGLMVSDQVVEAIPALLIPGHLLGLLCELAYGVILLRLARFTDRYRIAAWCTIVGTGVIHLASLLGFQEENPLWWLIGIPAAIAAYVGEYQEFYGHAEILTGADVELAQKWRTLWKWYIGALLAPFGGILVALIIPVLGGLVILGAALALVVVSILKLVYLYRTAQWFRTYRPEEREGGLHEAAL